MIRKQDFWVLLLYFMGYSKIRNIVFRLQRKSVTRIIAFHDIQPETFSNFKANIEFLKQKTNVVSFQDYFAGRLSSRKTNVIISFDDGYKSWLAYAVPVLKALRLPAAFFVTAGFVGLSKEAEAEFIKSKLLLTIGPRRISGGLNYDDVRSIVEGGFTLGGHTLNHCNLENVRDMVKVRKEIAVDKMRLEEIGCTNIEYFAYPSGAYYNPSIDLVEVLKELGFVGAVTTVPGFNSVNSNPYLLHRDILTDSTPGRVFRARIYGNYDVIRFIREWIRKVIQFP